MSKSSRAKSKDYRKKAKAARKAANQAYYAGLRDSGHNSKRAQRAAKLGRKVRMVSHRTGPCGNIGCAKCSPLTRELKLEKALTREGFDIRVV